MRKIDELKALFPMYAENIHEDCSGSVYVTDQQDLAALVDYVCECPDCCGCGGW